MEKEIKFSPVSPDLAQRILEQEDCFFGEAFEMNMNAVYFDTPERALKKAGASLRLRQENGRSVVCVKKRIDAITRIEEEVDAPTLEQGVALLLERDALPEGVKSALKGGDFIPRYGSRFLRRGRLLKAGESVVELAFDRGVLFRENRYCAVCEIELELKEGKAEDLEKAGQYFAQKYGLKMSLSTKAGRAAALTQDFFKTLEAVDVSAFSQEEVTALFEAGKLYFEESEKGRIYYR